MKRVCVTICAALAFAVAGMAGADDPVPGKERLRQLQRDLPLIEVLVNEGIVLAAEEDPLRRAGTCNAVAKTLVQEITQATKKRDERHAAELGELLEAVLVRGVADNLSVARARMPEDRQRDPEFARIGEEMIQFTAPVANPTSTAEQQMMGPAVDAVRKGRDALEKALKKEKAP